MNWLFLWQFNSFGVLIPSTSNASEAGISPVLRGFAWIVPNPRVISADSVLWGKASPLSFHIRPSKSRQLRHCNSFITKPNRPFAAKTKSTSINVDQNWRKVYLRPTVINRKSNSWYVFPGELRESSGDHILLLLQIFLLCKLPSFVPLSYSAHSSFYNFLLPVTTLLIFSFRCRDTTCF